MGLRSPVQCSSADAAAQSFLRSAGQFRDAAGKARHRAGGAEVTWRLHRLGGRLVSHAGELRPSLIFKSQAMRVLFLERATRSGQTGYVGIVDAVAIAPSDAIRFGQRCSADRKSCKHGVEYPSVHSLW